MNPEPDLSSRSLPSHALSTPRPKGLPRLDGARALHAVECPPPVGHHRNRARPAPRRRQPHDHAQSRGRGLPRCWYLPGGHPGQAPGLHRRLYFRWLPSEKPFMTVSVNFEPQEGGAKTRQSSACCTGPSPTARSTSA